ncbi:MAG: sodium:proton antiporter [Mariprofundus sp.]
MIITVLSIATILYLALQLQDKLKIPSPVGLIVLSFGFHAAFGDLFMLTGDAEHFATLVILLLPILLISDSLELKVEDLKEHGLSLFYLAVVIGYMGLIAMKTTDNRIAELLVLILTGYGAFELAEHFYALLNLLGGHSHTHLSGILTCIVATVTVHHVMSKAVAYNEMRIEKESEDLQRESSLAESSGSLVRQAIHKIRATVEERDRHLRSKEDIQLLAIVANTMLFVAMAEIINLDLLWQYRTEILVMFLATTLIRAAMMAKFAMLTNQTGHMTNVNFRWWGVLTFAGIKGGLSVVMLMMIPASFEHLEMFKAIVVGVIMLSTLIYSLFLIVIIGKNKDIFARELEQEGSHH